MKLYRYIAGFRYSGIELDTLDVCATAKPDPVLLTYGVFKETPKGYWIREGRGQRERWVSKTSRKRFAYPTPAMALDSLILRKRREIVFLRGKMQAAEENLELAVKLKNKIYEQSAQQAVLLRERHQVQEVLSPETGAATAG